MRFYIKKPLGVRGSVEAELIQLLTQWRNALQVETKANLYKLEKRNVSVSLNFCLLGICYAGKEVGETV